MGCLLLSHKFLLFFSEVGGCRTFLFLFFFRAYPKVKPWKNGEVILQGHPSSSIPTSFDTQTLINFKKRFQAEWCVLVSWWGPGQAVCEVGEYPCLFAEMRRRVKNNKRVAEFWDVWWLAFDPCLFSGKEKREKTIENWQVFFFLNCACHFSHQ